MNRSADAHVAAAIFAGAFLVPLLPWAQREPVPAAPDKSRTAYVCESCDRFKAFEAARKASDVRAADALVPALLEDDKRDYVAEYLVYDRGRCAEALALLEPERRNFNPKSSSSAQRVLTSALACEAARLEASDPGASRRLLAEAIDKDMVPGSHKYQSELYEKFANRDVLNEPVMRFLVRHQLDGHRAGYAIEAQIRNGNVQNVRRLLALGANPNESHGSQHAALGQTLDLLKKQPDVALQIAEVLLQAGADPAMLLDFSEEPERSELRRQPARQRFDAMLAEADARLARTMPVRIQFYDLESPYARFDIVNRSGKDVVLDSWRDAEGFEYAGDGASFEYRIAPGQEWIPYEFGLDGRVDRECMRRVLLEDGERTSLRVPFDPSVLLRSPPRLQVRLRLPSAGGIDYLSEAFALLDAGKVRGAWPLDPSATAQTYFVSGMKLELPDGLPKATEEAANIAPHSRPRSGSGENCPKP